MHARWWRSLFLSPIQTPRFPKFSLISISIWVSILSSWPNWLKQDGLLECFWGLWMFEPRVKTSSSKLKKNTIATEFVFLFFYFSFACGFFSVRFFFSSNHVFVSMEQDKTALLFLFFPAALMILRSYYWDGCLPAFPVQLYEVKYKELFFSNWFGFLD